MALLSFLSNALMLAPLDSSNFTIYHTKANWLYVDIYARISVCIWKTPTSTCPLKAAWCRAVRPARSDTLTLLSSGTKASAQRTALLLAATWSGVCQFLSRALTSALCFSNTATASWMRSVNGSECADRGGYFIRCLSVLTKYAPVCAGGCVRVVIKVFAILRGAFMPTIALRTRNLKKGLPGTKKNR